MSQLRAAKALNTPPPALACHRLLSGVVDAPGPGKVSEVHLYDREADPDLYFPVEGQALEDRAIPHALKPGKDPRANCAPPLHHHNM